MAETCARILIEALWRDSRRNEALRAYGELRRALADDLGSDPDARTHALYLQVLRGTAAAPTAASEHGHDVRISRGISSDEDLLDRLVGILLQSFGGPGGDRQGSNDTLIARLAAELLVA